MDRRPLLLCTLFGDGGIARSFNTMDRVDWVSSTWVIETARYWSADEADVAPDSRTRFVVTGHLDSPLHRPWLEELGQVVPYETVERDIPHLGGNRATSLEVAAKADLPEIVADLIQRGAGTEREIARAFALANRAGSIRTMQEMVLLGKSLPKKFTPPAKVSPFAVVLRRDVTTEILTGAFGLFVIGLLGLIVARATGVFTIDKESFDSIFLVGVLVVGAAILTAVTAQIKLCVDGTLLMTKYPLRPWSPPVDLPEVCAVGFRGRRPLYWAYALYAHDPAGKPMKARRSGFDRVSSTLQGAPLRKVSVVFAFGQWVPGVEVFLVETMPDAVEAVYSASAQRALSTIPRLVPVIHPDP